MRRKPKTRKIEEQFIESSPTEEKNSERISSNLIDRTQQLKWPVIRLDTNPIMNNGSSLRRPINLPVKEFEWNTVESHTKKLGVGKTEWISYAIYRLLIEEQEYYYNSNKRK